jgi:hypothetical protein
MGLLRYKATWRTWDEPDRQVAFAQWVERDLYVVFPLAWARLHGGRAMIARAKERIAEVEAKVRRHLVEQSVLVAFSRHEEQPALQQIAPEVNRALM